MFPLDFNDYELIENRIEINITVFGYENKVYPLYVSNKSHTRTLNFLIITEKHKSNYVFIKDFNRLMFSRTKHEDKKTSLHVLFTKFH